MIMNEEGIRAEDVRITASTNIVSTST